MLYPEVAEHAGDEIEEVNYVNAAPFDEDTLELLTQTRASECRFLGFLPFCVPGLGWGKRTERLATEVAAADAARLALFYRRSGYFGTTVRPTAMQGTDEDLVRVDFVVARGDSVLLDSLRIAGAEDVLDATALERRLPLQPGELFDLGDFDAAADTVLAALYARGHAHAQVLREYMADTLADRAFARLVAVPGPVVVVDSIEVRGVGSLGRKGALRQLSFRDGDIVRRESLAESEENLYALELIQFAVVQLAPDTVGGSPRDTVGGTIEVRVSEAPVHVVEASAGYGTVECFRGQARWVSRSFRGGGRRLAFNGALSKVGIGAPMDLGLEGSMCSAFEGDPFQDQLDYLIGADLTHPYFFGPRNQASINVHADRQSEPGVYQREAIGARLSANRRLRGRRRTARDAVTAVVEAERARTEATPVIFCLALQVCAPEDRSAARLPRWRNSVSGSIVRDRTDRLVDPTRGLLLRGTATWATPVLGSDVEFLRTLAESSLFRPVRRGWVAGGFLRLGNIWGVSDLGAGEDFLPPEDRFYAGGAYSVRGFGQNELGPLVYFTDDVAVDSATGALSLAEDASVRPIPVGGTNLVVGTAELRLPSPIMPRTVRLAVFVDAGALDTVPVWKSGGLKFTPGFGLRLTTPVGPIRADVAYNPYGLSSGPLYVSDPLNPGRLVRLRDNHAPSRGSFFQELRFHLAVGQAF